MNTITQETKLSYYPVSLSVVREHGCAMALLHGVICERYLLSSKHEQFTDQRGTFCLFTRKELAFLTNLSEKTIVRLLEQLKNNNLLEMTNKKTRYRFTPSSPDHGFEIHVPKFLSGLKQLKPEAFILYGYLYSCLSLKKTDSLSFSRTYLGKMLNISKNTVSAHIHKLAHVELLREYRSDFWESTRFFLYGDVNYKPITENIENKQLVTYKKSKKTNHLKKTKKSKKLDKSGTDQDNFGMSRDNFGDNYKPYFFVNLLEKYHYNHTLSIRENDYGLKNLINIVKKKQPGMEDVTASLSSFIVSSLKEIPHSNWIRCGSDIKTAKELTTDIKSLDNGFLLYALKRIANLVVLSPVRNYIGYAKTMIYGLVYEYLHRKEVRSDAILAKGEFCGYGGAYTVFGNKCYYKVIE